MQEASCGCHVAVRSIDRMCADGRSGSEQSSTCWCCYCCPFALPFVNGTADVFFRLLGWVLVCSGLMIKLGVTFRTATGLVVASQGMVKLTDKEGLPDSPVRVFIWRAVCAEASGFASELHGNVVRLLLSFELGCKGPFVGDP